MKEEEEEALPDHLRCSRTDGRQWRCKKRVMDDMKLCEIHYLQGRHRQYREKVPESLKLQRKSKKSSNGDSDGLNFQGFEIRAQKVGTTGKLMKRKPSVRISEALNETLKKMKMKKGDTRLELIRMVLKREVEKREKKEMDNKVNKKNKKKKKNVKKKSKESEMEENSDKGLMRELPNGLMAISPVPSIRHSDNAVPSRDIKIGAETGSLLCRRFRSKNIEPFPSGTLQVVPYGCNVGKLRKGKRKKCHWCQRSGPWSLTKCSSCQKEFFCMDCIKQRYFDTQEEVKMSCPVCRGTCNCKDCSANQSKDTESKDFLEDNNEVQKILCFHYLICMLLPVLNQLNKEQTAELETEAMIKGKKPSEVHIKQAESNEQRNRCGNCKTSIVDLHRSCLNCSYNLCLSCYWDLQRNKNFDNKQLPRNKRMRSSKQTCCSVCVTSSTSFPDERVCNGIHTVSCPSKENGGCGDSLLDLRCLLPLNWTKELEVSAEEVICSYDFPESMDTSSCCSLCLGKDHKADGIEQIQEAAVRKDSNDNYLYYPRLLDIHRENLEHFQRHWGKGHPVIVRNVLQTSDLCWDPVLLFCTYLERTIAQFENNKDLLESSNYLDWCEVEIGIEQYFMGSLMGRTHTNTWNDMLKLKGWLSSHLFLEQFPAHYAETIRALPLQEYVNPTSGLLNLAAKLPREIAKPDLGPCVYISYDFADERLHSDCLTRLCYDSYDVVNILAHSTDVPVSTEQLTKMIKLLQKQKTQRESSRIIPDQTMTNKVNEESSFHCKSVEEEPKCMSREEMKLSKRFSRGPKDVDMTHNWENDSDSNPTVHLCGTNQISETTNAQKKCGDRVGRSDCKGKKISNESSGAQWDVFRRQDVPKLIEYIKRHSYEFPNTDGFHKHVVHPILDQSFFLDTFHKMRLKEEFKIEPWSFEQQVGEAVIVPAGCPYQIRNPKSCVHVVLDFVSPENVAESIRLIDEVRVLPEDHRMKVEKLEVKKMALHTISEAIKEIRDLTCATQLL